MRGSEDCFKNNQQIGFHIYVVGKRPSLPHLPDLANEALSCMEPPAIVPGFTPTLVQDLVDALIVRFRVGSWPASCRSRVTKVWRSQGQALALSRGWGINARAGCFIGASLF